VPQLAPDDIAQLIPAFVGAAAVIVVVAVGVLIFVQRQYAHPSTEADRLERALARRSLFISGVVIVIFGALSAAVSFWLGMTTYFGPASILVPASVAVDGAIFLAGSRLLFRERG